MPCPAPSLGLALVVSCSPCPCPHFTLGPGQQAGSWPGVLHIQGVVGAGGAGYLEQLLASCASVFPFEPGCRGPGRVQNGCCRGWQGGLRAPRPGSVAPGHPQHPQLFLLIPPLFSCPSPLSTPKSPQTQAGTPLPQTQTGPGQGPHCASETTRSR